MKKKVLGIGLALAMALSMGAMAAPSSFADQFADDREQGPEWSYMYDNGDGWEEMVTADSQGFDYGDNWRLPKEIGDDVQNYTSFTNWEGVKADISGNDGNTVVAAVYEAASAGTAVIAPWTHTMNGVAEDYSFVDAAFDVTVKILHNDEELYTYTGKDGTAASEEITVEMAAGDRIYFVASAPGATAETLVSYDSVSVDFTAAEGGAEAPSTEEPAENPTTGEATTALPVMAAVVGLAALVLAKKAKKA
ncbi:MAG TPA: hypothetical protein H9694_11270 [Firmicutes bacterium]|nr:hypothetical protein [Bacillota bacterium]